MAPAPDADAVVITVQSAGKKPNKKEKKKSSTRDANGEPPNLHALFTPLDWMLFLLGGASMALCGVCLLYRFAQVGAFSGIVSSIELGIDRDAVQTLTINMFAAGVICWVAGWVATVCMNTVKDRQVAAWGAFYVRTALSQNISWLEAPGNAAKLHQASADAQHIANALSIDGYGGLFEVLGQLLSGIAIGFLVAPVYYVLLLMVPLVLIMLCCYPPLLKRQAQLGPKVGAAGASAMACAVETLHAHRTVAALCLEETRLATVQGFLTELQTLKQKSSATLGAVIGVGMCPTGLSFLIGYVYAVLYITREMDESAFLYELPAPHLASAGTTLHPSPP